MNQPLFSDFSPSSKEAWKQQTIKDLKGKDFEQTLFWQTAEGFILEPYYVAEDLTDPRTEAVRAAQVGKTGWLNQPLVVFEDELKTNAKMTAALQKGADAILLDLNYRDLTTISFPKLLNGIKLSDIPVVFQTNGQSPQLMAALKNFIPYQMKGGLADDGLARWSQTGQLPNDYFEQVATILTNTKSSPSFRTIGVESHVFHSSGANAAQELAFALGVATTYLDKLTDLGLGVEQILSKIYFSLSVGINYFMEIAKQRALRYLWSEICHQFAPTNDAQPLFIHAQTSTFYNAAASPYTNLLRASTEAMSAVMGGTDALTVLPYNEIAGQADEFAERIARNISVLLKEESHLDKTTDPAAGSYYLENLTLQLIDATWALFLEVENRGGFMPAFEQNFVQDEIEKSFRSQSEMLKSGHSVMVGVNKYQTKGDELETRVAATETNTEGEFKLLTNRRIAAISN